jgi:hypothetical protein
MQHIPSNLAELCFYQNRDGASPDRIAKLRRSRFYNRLLATAGEIFPAVVHQLHKALLIAVCHQLSKPG